MIINTANLQIIYQSVSTIFNEVFETTPSVLNKLATTVPSATREEIYVWLGRFPKMREWLGERVLANMKSYDYSIKNRDWESTVVIDRNDIEDDRYGVYKPLVASMAEAAKYHPDELLYELLLGGFTGLCYDGLPFFSAAHLYGPDGVTQSNLGHGLLNSVNYAAARSLMMSLQDDQGKILNIMPDLLVVPPQLEEVGRILLNNDLIAASSNQWKGSAELLVVPGLSANPTAWYLFDTKKAVKSMIFQQRRVPQVVMINKPDDESVFMNKEFKFGVDSRDNAGYGLWQLAYGSDGTQ
jgi:phage major head subunit gpT-like protein